jgi:hypothetical protein
MNNRLLIDRLNPASRRALILWAVNYALNNRDEINPAALAALRNGNESQRRAADLLTRYGLDLSTGGNSTGGATSHR